MAVRMQLRDLLQSSGLFLPDNPDAVWLLTDAEEIGTIYPAVDLALRQRPAYRLVVAVPRHQAAGLRRRFPHEQIVALATGPRWIRPAPYASAALQILGKRYHELSGALPRSLRVDRHFNARSVVQRLPEKTLSKEETDDSVLRSRLVRAMAGSPIASLKDLALRLGSPHHILCLGNGPSSEDPGLENLAYDCLFRVNWIWRDRKLHVNPNLVFTADLDLPFGSPGPIIGLPDRAQGLPVVRRHCLLLRAPRRGYLFAGEILPATGKLQGSLEPSNGAIMIAVAAALKPGRITIAGIDLYAHDQGRYPGDKDAVDGYSRDHSRAADLEFIRSALDSYEGELGILSEELSRALRE